uniref:U3 small nucleolar RNA-associated protein 6 homolog C-terminal domain-containing protein n=1 Tax=Megaselia scalaris TaxID=36166 RepID=T1GPV0_MEGSC
MDLSSAPKNELIKAMKTYSNYISFLNALKNGFEKSKKCNMEKISDLARGSEEFKRISNNIQDLAKIIKKIVDNLYVLYIGMLEAMKWAFTKRNDMNLAKKFFIDIGVKYFFTKTPIFLTYLSFLYERMLHIIDDLEKKNSFREFVMEKLEGGIKEVIKEIKAGPVKQFDYLTKVLNQCEDLNHYFTIPIQAAIIGIMQGEFPQSEEFFNILALRELKGFNRCDLENCDLNEVMRNGYKKRSKRTCINLAYLTFEKSYELFKSNRMWEYFLDALPNITEVDSNDQPIIWKTFQEFKISSKRYKVWKISYEKKMLKESHLIAYVQQLIEIDSSNDEVLEIFEYGVEHYPNSIKLWEYYMAYFENNEDDEGVIKTFYRGSEELHKILDSACRLTHKDFLHFRIICLEYIFYQFGLEKAREIFTNISKFDPPYKPLLVRMLEFEKTNVNCDKDKIKEVYELLIFHFGDEDVDIWIEFLTYASSLTDEADNKLFQQIVGRARTTLKDLSLSNFETQWKHIEPTRSAIST